MLTPKQETRGAAWAQTQFDATIEYRQNGAVMKFIRLTKKAGWGEDQKFITRSGPQIGLPKIATRWWNLG